MRIPCDCKELVLIGTTIALDLSQDMTAEELVKLSGLLYIIADELALLSLCAPNGQTVTEEEAAGLY